MVNNDNSHGIGFLSLKSDPIKSNICSIAQSNELFINSQWINPVQEDTGTAVFDNLNGTGLILGKKGVSFIEWNSVNAKNSEASENINNGDIIKDEYMCRELSQWLAPTGQMENIDKNLSFSSCDNGLIAINIKTGFNRLLLANRILPMTCEVFETNNKGTEGITEHIKLSIGKHSGEIGSLDVTKILYPENIFAPIINIPWENIYKSAVDLRALNVVTNNFSYGKLLEGLPIILRNITHDTHYARMGYGVLTKAEYDRLEDSLSWGNRLELYSWSLNDHYNLFFVNPDTGELNTASIAIDLTEYYTTPNEPLYPMWHSDYFINGSYDTYNGIPFVNIVTKVDTWPFWSQETGFGFIVKLYKNYYYALRGEGVSTKETIFVPANAPNVTFIPPENWGNWKSIFDWYSWKESPDWYFDPDEILPQPDDCDEYLEAKLPCLDVTARFFFAPDIVSDNITQGNMTFATNMICYPYLVFTENSTKAKFLLRSSLFGEWTSRGKLTGIAGEIYNSKNQQWIFGAQPMKIHAYPYSPITNHKGEIRYAKTLYIIVLSGDEWTTGRFVILRADVNPEMFDFNSELLKSKCFINKEQEGVEEE